MPAGSTYECIESKVLASSTATVTFSSIPNTYTDLILIMQPSAGSPNGNAMRMRLNGNSESVYSATFLDGTGSSLVSARTGTIAQLDLGWRVGIDSSAINQTYYMHFLNYKNTNNHKYDSNNNIILNNRCFSSLNKQNKFTNDINFSLNKNNVLNNTDVQLINWNEEDFNAIKYNVRTVPTDYTNNSKFLYNSIKEKRAFDI
jgi:hypothetical protein